MERGWGVVVNIKGKARLIISTKNYASKSNLENIYDIQSSFNFLKLI